MKHAKRMVLVPEDVFARFEQKQKIESSPLVRNMINADQEMTNVLQKTDMSDSEKQKLYYTNLERYMNLQQRKDNEIPTVRLTTSDKSNVAETSAQEMTPLPDVAIVDSLPKTKQQKAKAILKPLKTRPDIVSWDESGRVTLDGAKVPESNISDLVSDAVKGRKTFILLVRKSFLTTYQNLTCPKILLEMKKDGKKLKWTVFMMKAGALNPLHRRTISVPLYKDMKQEHQKEILGWTINLNHVLNVIK